MNIGMILNAPYPSDIRVKKEFDALRSAGFNVFLLCLRQDGEKYEDAEGDLHITRIDAGKNDYELAFWDVVMSMTFRHPLFRRAIPGWVKKNDIRSLHIHDLPVVGTALSLRKKLGIPVIADFHENYPDALRIWFEWKRNPLARVKNKLFMNADVWTRHEKKATMESDRVIAVVQEMKDRLVRDYQAPSDKISVITNSEDFSFLLQPEDPEIYSAYPGRFIITYSGNIGPHRGVDTVIEAMQYLRHYPEITFIIVGSGSEAVMHNLSGLVSRFELENNVFFLGRQPFAKFYSYMKFADANIIPHKSNGHTDNTIPHKLFQAMMVGKPVIVSSSAPLKRVVSQAESGMIFAADDAKDLSEKIIALYESKPLQQQLGSNGYNATVKGKMNWQTDQQQLIDLYNKLVRKEK
jgi:glycosyltransferase involved in cell wall biosynthesis